MVFCHLKRLGKIGSLVRNCQKMKKRPSALLAALELPVAFTIMFTVALCCALLCVCVCVSTSNDAGTGRP